MLERRGKIIVRDGIPLSSFGNTFKIRKRTNKVKGEKDALSFGVKSCWDFQTVAGYKVWGSKEKSGLQLWIWESSAMADTWGPTVDEIIQGEK